MNKNNFIEEGNSAEEADDVSAVDQSVATAIDTEFDSPIIIPAIMPTNFKDLDFKASMVHDVVPRVQIDVMDGKFVDSLSWPFKRPSKGVILSDTDAVSEQNDHLDVNFRQMQSEEKGLPYWSTLDYDVDLMVENPAKAVDEWAKVGVTRVILHLREHNINDIAVAIEVARERMLDVIVALLPIDMTPKIKSFIFEKHIEEIYGIQFMGIEKVGYQRQVFSPKVFTLIKTVIDELHTYNQTRLVAANSGNGVQISDPSITINAEISTEPKYLELSVDGGVTHENARPLYDAGVDKLVSGSVVFDSDSPRQQIEFFQDILG